MRADYFEDLRVPSATTMSPRARGHRKPRNDGNVPTVPDDPTRFDAHLAELAGLPLAAKLHAYGEPFPLMVNGRVAAWLVPDERSRIKASEPVYTAVEVERMSEGRKHELHGCFI